MRLQLNFIWGVCILLRVISYDVGFNPSTQRYYRRLIYYLYIHSYMFRSYDHHQAENCQLSSPKVVIYFSA
jgi:hypothetical protein